MKNLIFTTILIISNYSVFGQEAKVITGKEKYKFDEVIKVTFEIDAKYDSIALPDFTGLKLIGGPFKNSSISVSVENWEKTVSELRTYRLVPTESGQIKIKSPIYFVDGKKIEGKGTEIAVDTTGLNSEEKEKNIIQNFIEDSVKPKETTRIIFHENMGYIEIFDKMGWQVLKRLSSEEIEQIKKLTN